MSQPDTVTFKVGQPRDLANHYLWDPQEKALRMDKVSQPGRQLPADYGMVQSQVWGHDLLPGLLFSTLPVAEGVLVPGRVFGGLRGKEPSDIVALVANTVDPAFSAMSTVGDDLRDPVETFAAEILGVPRVDWLDAQSAVEVVRQAQRRARTGAAGTTRPTSRAWQATGPTAETLQLSHTYSPAEYSLYRLPWRFQQYVPDLLVSDERVHYFVHRPEWRGGLLRRTALKEGLLVLTDREVLFLADTVPPGMTMAQWGYLAKTVAVERLEAVTTRRQGGVALLILTVAGNAGDEEVSLPFSAEAEPRLALAAQLLEGFLPGRQSRAVLRLYEVESVRNLVAVPSGEGDVGYREAGVLAGRERFKSRVKGPDSILADTLAPGLESGQPTRWLAVTRDAMLLATEAGPTTLEISFGDLTSLELQYSTLGCFLRMNAGDRHWQIDFHSPWFPAFHPVYFAARQRLAQPLALTRPAPSVAVRKAAEPVPAEQASG